MVAKCIELGLVGGEGFSIDASLIKADVDKKKRAPGDQPIAWPPAEEASRAVREYLMALDAARNDEEDKGADESGPSGGGSRRKPPKEVSVTDPHAAWVARAGVDPFFAYDANYLIDNRAGITKQNTPNKTTATAFARSGYPLSSGTVVIRPTPMKSTMMPTRASVLPPVIHPQMRFGCPGALAP